MTDLLHSSNVFRRGQENTDIKKYTVLTGAITSALQIKQFELLAKITDQCVWHWTINLHST